MEANVFDEVKKRKRNEKVWFIYDLDFVKEIKFK